MATRKKKTKVKAKTKAKTKVGKKKPAAKKKARKSTPRTPAPPVEQTQQVALAQIIGDIEERMALDRLAETK